VVDERRLRRLLKGIQDDLVFLARFAGQDVDAIVGDEVVLAAIKYRFITAIEGCAKVAHHLSASEAWPVAETNADAVRILAQQGVLSRELAATVAAAVGFRNLLVHQYGDIDNRRAMENLAHLDELQHFVDSVTRWASER
jgi:uncharacterized protein YutE (UPF0331/DUF86 family)